MGFVDVGGRAWWEEVGAAGMARKHPSPSHLPLCLPFTSFCFLSSTLGTGLFHCTTINLSPFKCQGPRTVHRQPKNDQDTPHPSNKHAGPSHPWCALKGPPSQYTVTTEGQLCSLHGTAQAHSLPGTQAGVSGELCLGNVPRCSGCVAAGALGCRAAVSAHREPLITALENLVLSCSLSLIQV